MKLERLLTVSTFGILSFLRGFSSCVSDTTEILHPPEYLAWQQTALDRHAYQGRCLNTWIYNSTDYDIYS
jgi:hypothetical protein